MNLSIRKQFTVIFIGLMAFMFLANFLINTFFLESFYYVRKQEVLVKAYQMLDEDMDELGRVDEKDEEDFEDLCNENGISYLVTDLYYDVVLGSESNSYASIMKGRLNGYGIGLDQDDAKVLTSNDNYTIQRKYDNEIGLNYLEMWGILDKGFYFIMRINIESIQDSVRISNEFMGYICIIAIMLSALFVWLVTRRLTRPLAELTDLSKRMAELDFNAKYTSGGSNEIGQLGEHFNEMSEALQKAYAQLMTANNELLRDIEQKQQIDEKRQEFLSNVSHELKTPIALIQGYAEGLQECVNDDPESREFYCEVIMDEAAKMNELVQELLTLDSLEDGEDQVEMDRFDLTQLIRNKIQSEQILAQQKGVEISYTGEPSLFAWGDEFRIEEVLNNYLSNALNHVSEKGRIEVSAQRRPDEKDGGYLAHVTVFNTGEQIPEEDIGEIWEKFYKVDKARTREYGGSGVGLSIVKAIMDSHHQAYGVENREDGVAFWFELRCDNTVPEEAADDPAGDGAGKNSEIQDGEWRPEP